MSSATRQPFSPTEHAWIHSQTAENLPVTTVVLLCEEPPDPSFLKARIEDRLLAEQRFRQHIGHPHRPLARPRWQEHEDFQLADHYFLVDLRDLSPDTALADWIARLASQPLADHLPLWQIHLGRLPAGRAAVVLRAHAAVADSQAAARLALRLVDNEAELPTSAIGFEHLLPPRPLRERAGSAAAATRTLCQLITSRVDHHSPFRASLSGEKKVHWSTPVDLGDPTSTPTYRLLAGLVGGLRRAVQRHDIPAEDIALRAIVSLSLRAPEDDDIGTRSAAGLLRLPVAMAGQQERIEALREELDRLARSPEDFVLLGCETGRSLSMSEIEERLLHLLSQKASIAVAILDGPAETQVLCGVPVSELLWWPALTGDTALGVSLSSYAGQGRWMVSADRALDLDARALVDDIATLSAAG